MQVQGFDWIWSIGDCAKNISEDGTILPATAQQATKMAKALSTNIAHKLQDRELIDIQFESSGTVANLGFKNGVINTDRFNLFGRKAWLLRKAFYLWKIPGLKNKKQLVQSWVDYKKEAKQA